MDTGDEKPYNGGQALRILSVTSFDVPVLIGFER
jgi:hypothetical protein